MSDTTQTATPLPAATPPAAPTSATASTPPPIPTPATKTEKPRKEPGSALQLYQARAMSWGWFGVKLLVGVIYFALISQGFLNIFPDTGQRLYKAFPLFDGLQDYEWSYNLKVAHFCSIVLLLITWIAWYLLQQLLLDDKLLKTFGRWGWDEQFVKRFVIVCSLLVIVGDAGLFYRSFQSSAFGDAGDSQAFCLVATLVWVSVLVFVNFISAYLSRCVTDELEKLEEKQ